MPEARWGVAGAFVLQSNDPWRPWGSRNDGLLGTHKGLSYFPRKPVFRSIFWTPFRTPFFPKVTPQGSPKGPQKLPKWSPKSLAKSGLVFNVFPLDLQQETLTILLIARYSKTSNRCRAPCENAVFLNVRIANVQDPTNPKMPSENCPKSLPKSIENRCRKPL